MSGLDIDTKDPSEQRKFGVVMGVAISILGLIRWWLHSFEHFPTPFFIVAAVFAVVGLVFPLGLYPVFVVWIKFAEVLNWIMTRVFLGIAFFGMITPTRVILQVFSEDPMKREWQPDADTYWEEAEEQPEDMARYFNQF